MSNNTRDYHFSKSRVNNSLDEPLFLTKFSANIILPDILKEKYGTAELLHEQMLKIGGLDLDKVPGTVTQKFRYNDRSFIGTILDTKVELSFDFEVNVDSETNVPYPYNLLQDWLRLCYDPNTGFQSLKKDYAGKCTIDVTDKIGRLIRHVDVGIMFPKSNLPAWELNNTQEAIYKINGFKFQCENVKSYRAEDI